MQLSAFINEWAILQENILLQRLVIITIYALLAKAVDIFLKHIYQFLET